jgi:hypothetical protein
VTERFDGHTPGRWHVTASGGAVYGPDPTHGALAHVFVATDLATCLADAHLIAAAPDLLAEVASLREALAHCYEEGHDTGHSLCPDCTKARALLASKPEGGGK